MYFRYIFYDNDSLLSLLSLWYLREGLIGWDDKPKLIITSVDVVLQYFLSFCCFSLGNVESASPCMGLDDVGFVGPFSSGGSGYFEPAAGVLSGIDDDVCCVVLVVLEDTQTCLFAGVDKGQFGVVVEDIELLGCVADVIFVGVFARCVVSGQGLGFVED